MRPLLAGVSLLIIASACASNTQAVPDSFVPMCSGALVCYGPAPVLWSSSNPLPRYPSVMQAAAIPGRVDVSFRINADGSVDSASIVLDTVTNRAFGIPVRAAVAKWMFSDGSNPGVRKPRHLTIRTLFVLAHYCHWPSQRAAAWMFPDSLPTMIITDCGPPLIPRDQVIR